MTQQETPARAAGPSTRAAAALARNAAPARLAALGPLARIAPLAAATLATLAALSSCAAPDPAPQLLAEWQPTVAAFAEQVAAGVQQDGGGGMTVALARDGEVLWWGAYGWADPGTGIPVARETIYRTGSISKSVTAALMAVLAEEGAVSLDSPLEELVPESATWRTGRQAPPPPCAR